MMSEGYINLSMKENMAIKIKSAIHIYVKKILKYSYPYIYALTNNRTYRHAHTHIGLLTCK
jgi:hypothetical protein